MIKAVEGVSHLDIFKLVFGKEEALVEIGSGD